MSDYNPSLLPPKEILDKRLAELDMAGSVGAAHGWEEKRQNSSWGDAASDVFSGRMVSQARNSLVDSVGSLAFDLGLSDQQAVPHEPVVNTNTGSMAAGLLEYGLPYGAASKGLKIFSSWNKLGRGANFLTHLGAYMAIEGGLSKPGGNLANLAKDHVPGGNVLSFLAQEEGESPWTRRLKDAVVGSALNIGVDAVLGKIGHVQEKHVTELVKNSTNFQRIADQFATTGSQVTRDQLAQGIGAMCGSILNAGGKIDSFLERILAVGRIDDAGKLDLNDLMTKLAGKQVNLIGADASLNSYRGARGAAEQKAAFSKQGRQEGKQAIAEGLDDLRNSDQPEGAEKWLPKQRDIYPIEEPAIQPEADRSLPLEAGGKVVDDRIPLEENPSATVSKDAIPLADAERAVPADAIPVENRPTYGFADPASSARPRGEGIPLAGPGEKRPAVYGFSEETSRVAGAVWFLRDVQKVGDVFNLHVAELGTKAVDGEKALLGFTKDADFSDVLHELFHAGRRWTLVDNAAEQTLRSAIGMSEHDLWNKGFEEKATEQFMRWLINGKAENPKTKEVFGQVFAWMKKTYEGVAEGDWPTAADKINPNVAKMFEAIIEDPSVLKKVPSVQARAGLGAKDIGSSAVTVEQIKKRFDEEGVSLPGVSDEQLASLMKTEADLEQLVAKSKTNLLQKPEGSTITSDDLASHSPTSTESELNPSRANDGSGASGGDQQIGLHSRRIPDRAGETPNVASLFSRRRPLPATVTENLGRAFTEAVTSGASADRALAASIDTINVNRMAITDDLVPGLAALEKEVSPLYEKSRPNEAAMKYTDGIRDLVDFPDEDLKFMQANAEELKHLDSRALATRQIYGKVLTETAQTIRDSSGSPDFAARLPKLMKRLQQAALFRKQVSQEIGRALQSYNIKVTASEGVEPVVSNLTEMIQIITKDGSNTDPATLEKIARIVVAGAEKGDAEFAGVVKSLNTEGGSILSKVLSTHNEIWLNALLSGVKTHLTNPLGNASMMFLLPTTRLAGGVLSGNKAAVEEGLHLFTNLAYYTRDLFGLGDSAASLPENSIWNTAKKAFFNEESVLTAAAIDYPKAISAANLGIRPGTTLAKTVDFVGRTVRLPGRFLTAADEIFKQLNYRAAVRTRAFAAAKREGLTIGTKEFDGYVNDFVKGSFDDAGKAVFEEELNYAKKATFTSDFEDGTFLSSLDTAINSHPLWRIVMPFVKVPVNILKTGFDYTPFLNLMRRKTLRELMSADPVIRADARGRLAVGSAFWSMAGYSAATGQITGGGPKDAQLRAQLMETGWRPYSIRVGDKYLDYSRVEPFASLLGLSADAAEIMSKVDVETGNQIAEAVTVALGRNISNKSFLQGLNEVGTVLSAQDENKVLGALQRRAGSYIPGAVKQFAATDELREARSFMDSVVRRNIPGLSDNLEPKRNLLGEKVWSPLGGLERAISPLALAGNKSDPIFDELTNLNYGFSSTPKQVRGVDLTVLTVNGRSAYDAFQEGISESKINGKTLRESLGELIRSKRYKALSAPEQEGDEFNGRVREVRATIAKYRERALNDLEKKYPEIKKAQREVARMHRDSLRPKSSVELLTASQR